MWHYLSLALAAPSLAILSWKLSHGNLPFGDFSRQIASLSDPHQRPSHQNQKSRLILSPAQLLADHLFINQSEVMGGIFHSIKLGDA